MTQHDCVPGYSGPGWLLYRNDVLRQLHNMEADSVHCVVTSPPYWGLRDYGVEGQIGLEGTIEEYVEKMVEVFEQVRRVLRPDGTLWLNLGDSYAGSWCGNSMRPGFQPLDARVPARNGYIPKGLKRKDLMGMPWRIAFSLQAAGWWLRSDIIWSKPNPMPESVDDRPSRAHEYLFLMSKSDRYFYDAAAIREPAKAAKDPGTGNRSHRRALNNLGKRYRGHPREHEGFMEWDSWTKEQQQAFGANKRTVWEIATRPFLGAHFATFPEQLVTPCVLAGCPEDGTVMDPFAGSGMVGIVALGLGRRFYGIELKSAYAKMAAKRLQATPWQTQIPTGGKVAC